MQISQEITIQVTPQVVKAYQLATKKEKQRPGAIASLFCDEEAKEDVDFLG